MSCAWTTTSTRTARTRPSRSRSPSRRASDGPASSPASGTRLDHHAVDAAHQPGARRRARHRLRGRRPADGKAPPSARGQLPARRGPAAPTPRTSATARPTRRRPSRHRPPTWPGCDVHAALRLLRRRRGERAPGACSADYVTTTDGTGIVHQAPAFGEDDQASARPPASRVVAPVDEARVHHRGARDIAGHAGVRRQQADHRPQALRAAGPRLRPPGETYEHSYPHCWRCRNPLIYKAVSAGSCGSPSSATAWSSSTSRSPGCRATSRTASSASGSPTRATGRSAATATGARPIPVWK